MKKVRLGFITVLVMASIMSATPVLAASNAPGATVLPEEVTPGNTAGLVAFPDSPAQSYQFYSYKGLDPVEVPNEVRIPVVLANSYWDAVTVERASVVTSDAASWGDSFGQQWSERPGTTSFQSAPGTTLPSSVDFTGPLTAEPRTVTVTANFLRANELKTSPAGQITDFAFTAEATLYVNAVKDGKNYDFPIRAQFLSYFGRYEGNSGVCGESVCSGVSAGGSSLGLVFPPVAEPAPEEEVPVVVPPVDEQPEPEPTPTLNPDPVATPTPAPVIDPAPSPEPVPVPAPAPAPAPATATAPQPEPAPMLAETGPEHQEALIASAAVLLLTGTGLLIVSHKRKRLTS